jgi:hypothetical protein
MSDASSFYRIDVTHYVTVGAHMRWLASGVGAEASFKAHSPVKLSVHVDGPEHTLSVKYFTPKEVCGNLFTFMFNNVSL